MLPRVDYAVVETQHSRKRCPNAMINLELYLLDHGLEMDNTDESTQHVQTGWNFAPSRAHQHRPRDIAAHVIIYLFQQCIMSLQQNNRTQLSHPVKIEGRALASDLSSS
jgi:hypothetical protein